MDNYFLAQLFNTNAFSLNILSTFTAIHSQSIVNTNNFFTYFYQRKQISRKLRWIYIDQANSLRVISLEVLGQNVLVLNVLVLNSCASPAFICQVKKHSTRGKKVSGQLVKFMVLKYLVRVYTRVYKI